MSSNSVDGSSWKFLVNFYHSIIEPTLPELFQFFGAVLEKSQRKAMIKFFENSRFEELTVPTLQIHWQDEQKQKYPSPKLEDLKV
ncbi:MAG: hypothetical protein HWD61_06330 [Parachlamydiaceae bacterium]|nr:MAG: hypothetical protein HWD61_06330 [Parachlamydiaceae bacterium]